VDTDILIRNLKLKERRKSTPPIEKISVEVANPNHGFWLLLILFGIESFFSVNDLRKRLEMDLTGASLL